MQKLVIQDLIITLAFTSLILAGGCAKNKKPAGQEVQITVTEKGFEPARSFVHKGEPVTLVVERKTDQTCAKEIVLEGLNIKKALPLNQAVRIALPADVIGDSLSYACGMDMYTGVIVAQ
jgi:plastocyanin domain-containing protein